MPRRKIHGLQPQWLWLIALSLSLAVSQLTFAQGNFYPAARSGGNYMHNFYLPPSPSSTPWAPAWSPDGESIAVSMQGSIWKVDPDSGAAVELTYNQAYHSSPDWSPDGRWIIYTADHEHQRIQLEIVDTSSGVSLPLTDDQAIYTDPVFSPDGSKVAYVSTNPSGYFNVYVRPISNGRWNGPAVAITSDNSFGRNRLYFGDGDMHITPTWFPDSSELLIVSNRDVPLGSGNVLRVPAVADGILQAKTVLAEQSLFRTRPDVSIDGRRFVYASTRGAADQYNNLYVQPTVGGEPYKITFFQHDAFHPRWSPDGEWIVFVSNEHGVSELKLLETYGGELKTVAITEQHFKRPTGVLKVRVTKAGNGEVTHNRIHLNASDNKLYTPNEAYARATARGDMIFHNSGEFEVRLPVGEVTIDVVKGFEFYPQQVSAQIVEDSVTELSVSLQQMDDMAAKGWYNASTHVHANYAGNLHNTLENLIMMSRSEDQDLVLEQVANKDNRILDYQYFIPGGDIHPTSTVDQLVVVGQEYRPPFYGHVFMFGLRDHLISPFVTGYEGTAVESLYPSNTDMLRKAKAQGATVGYVHAFGGEADPLQGNLGGGKGFMVDVALGATDALEWSDAGRGGFNPLYAAWNNGLHVTATGGEDSISSLHRSKLVGSVRTYVYTGNQGLDMQAWFAALRKGRAFVSSGPLLEMRSGNALPGDTVQLSAVGEMVEISGRLRSITPLNEVLLVCNGNVIKNFPLGDDKHALDLKYEFALQQSSWCHLRTEGEPQDRFPLDIAYAQAFTNPIWYQFGNSQPRNSAAAQYGIDWVDKLQVLAEAWPGWRSQAEKDHVFAQFEAARQVYRAGLQP